MKFKYRARTKEGELQVGFVEAGNKNSAATVLASHDLFILSLEAAEREGIFDALSSYFGRVKRKDMIVFTRQLATLLEARLPLNTALKTLYTQTNQPVLKEAVYQMSEDIDAGLSFSQAMERQGNIFPKFYVEMIRASEITGNLNEVAGFIADYAEKEGILASKATSALIYPTFIVGLFLLVAFIMIAVVFPQLGPVFENAGVALPVYTRILLDTGTFLNTWWPVIVVAVFFLFIWLLDYIRTPEGQAAWDDLKVKLPVMNKVYVPLTLARFSNAATLLIHGGIPIAQTLEIVSYMVSNVLYKDILRGVAQDVRQGELLSQSIAKHPDFFPDIVNQMVAVGETSGKLEQTFSRLSSFYTRETDEIMNNLVDLIQPTLMVLIGIMVGFLFASILVPLYALTSSIR